MAPTGEPTLEPISSGVAGAPVLTVVFDNNEHDVRLRTGWGFACVVETGDTTILFDTGADGLKLVSNMSVLDVDPVEPDVVMLSHIHGDHTGGLAGFSATGARPAVYVPRSFPADFKARVERHSDLCEVSGPEVIAKGVYTTGEMGSGIVEQALLLKTTRGLVVITGCAHPGIVPMVERAMDVGEDRVYLLLGGFHLGGKKESEIGRIISSLRLLGVRKVAPCHCTGDLATRLFETAYGEDFVRTGVGKIVDLGADER